MTQVREEGKIEGSTRIVLNEQKLFSSQTSFEITVHTARWDLPLICEDIHRKTDVIYILPPALEYLLRKLL